MHHCVATKLASAAFGSAKGEALRGTTPAGMATGSLAPNLIQLPSSIAFTTEPTETTEKTRESKCPKSSSVLSVGSVVKALTVKYFENAGS